LGDGINLHHLTRRVPLHPGRRQGFPSKSFRIELSRRLSANDFLRRAFLRLKRLQPAGVRDVHAAELRLPLIKSR
jgi:hypothetical protein